MRTEHLLGCMALVTALTVLTARRRRSRRAATLLVVADLVLAGAAGLAFPLWGNPPVVGALAAMLALLAAAAVRERQAPRRARPAFALAFGLGLAIALFGNLEWAVRIATKLHVFEHYRPVVTVTPPGVEDWRFAHITADELREPDPVLLWRNADRPPYNRFRLRGLEPTLPKPPGLFRVMCYGDSNTDGPPGWGSPWPQQLHECAQRRGGDRAIEVLNAGVTGYTSHQGLLLFEQQVEELQPDLAFVSFGWNDCAPASGRPDRDYVPPPRLVVAAQRCLVRYELYLCAMALLRPAESGAAAAGDVPRVAAADYAQNLRRFVEVGRRHHCEVVLLTRPHRTPAAELAQVPGWRARVPEHNRTLLAVARELGVAAVDVQGRFERWTAEVPDAAELWNDDCHFTDAGHRRMAELLWQEVLASR